MKEINIRTENIERELQTAVSNHKLINLQLLGKSLVYFTTSLKANEIMIGRLSTIKQFKVAEDDEELSRIISAYLRQTISTYDFKEHFYHAFLAGLLSGAGYIVKSNRESGEGRPDIILLDRKGGKAAVFELKRANSIEDMEKAAEKAVNQLKDRDYGGDIIDYDEIISFGISFFRKRALVKISDRKIR